MDISLVNSSDFREDQKKYIELAKRERVISTQRGTTNLQKAITADELLIGIEADIREIYKNKAK
jgi:hypothetical protein